MQRRLEGKTAIVTGGGGGIGVQTGLLFCQEGAKVLLVDRDKDALAQARRQILHDVPDAAVEKLVADMGREESAQLVSDAAVSAFGKISILINNAGMRAYESLAESKTETWQDVLGVNLLGYVYLAREALPHLRKERGAVVNISSVHAFLPRAGMVQYDVTKAGIISLTKTMAAEEAQNGVRVNALCPGFTLTPFHVKRFEEAGGRAEEIEQEDRKECLLRRWAHPREVAYPILWLASDEASYVTGTALMVDGGMPVFKS